MDAALQQHRLTLLVAPAGYGKTAALTRQIRLLPAGCALAWLSADEDDQLQRFLACLTTALEPYDLPWRVAPDALVTLALAERGVRGAADELVNALAGADRERGLIVIDDAHRIADPRVFELIQAVVDRLPEHWCVALATRTEPPLSLARWRARGELAEFRQTELLFSQADVEALLAGSRPGAGVTSLDLLQRTQGWAAGLRLSLATRPGGGMPGAGASTQRHLFDFLASEVLDDLPADLRLFLLRCSILPELTASRCAQVSQLPNVPRLMEEVERRGLFVASLDASEPTLRLHDLFRDFLEDRLRRDHPAELAGLLRRAADDEPDLVRAIGYLARAGAWKEAADELERRGSVLVTTGSGPVLEEMLAHFPAQEFARHPGLQLLSGLAAFQRFDFDVEVARMRCAARGYEQAGRTQAAALCWAYACCGMLNTGEIAEAVAHLDELRSGELDDAALAMTCFAGAWAAYAQQRSEDVAPHVAAMLDALEHANDLELWDRCFYVSILCGLPGMRPLLERFAAGALRVVDESPTQLRAAVMHVHAWLAFSRGQLDEAAACLARADEDCRWLGHPRGLQTENWVAHTLIDAARGDRAGSYAAALENKRDMEQRAFGSNRLAHEYEELYAFIRAAWLLGDVDTLVALDAQLARTGNPQEWPAAAGNRLMSRACIALMSGRHEEACGLLRPLVDVVERNCFFQAAQARLMLADALLALGRPADAAAELGIWCAAVRAGGDVGGAFMAGPAVLRRLAAGPWGDALSARDLALVVALANSLPVAGTPADGGPAGPPAANGPAGSARGGEPRAAPGRRHTGLSALTPREREILACMAAGDSNKLIARALDLSPHTVKRHVANILDKLGLETRGRAAALWRDAVDA